MKTPQGVGIEVEPLEGDHPAVVLEDDLKDSPFTSTEVEEIDGGDTTDRSPRTRRQLTDRLDDPPIEIPVRKEMDQLPGTVDPLSLQELGDLRPDAGDIANRETPRITRVLVQVPGGGRALPSPGFGIEPGDFWLGPVRLRWSQLVVRIHILL